MIRYPLIEARMQRTPWCATPEIIHAAFRAVRSPRIDPGSVSSQQLDASVLKARRVFASDSQILVADLDQKSSSESIAVIPVHGIIGKYLSAMEMLCGGGFDLQALERDLRIADADPTITDIVLQIVSPGGVIHGVSEAARLIAKINTRKPVWAYTDANMCSAAYWLGSACSGVFCSEMSTIGSIGVYLAWIDNSVAMEMEGLKLMLFKDGEFKASTLPGQLNDAAGQLLQNEVKTIGSAFRSHVIQSRAAASGVVVADETMQGQVFIGQQAIDVGLADSLFTSLDDLITDLLNR